jgi:hypothetical protein
VAGGPAAIINPLKYMSMKIYSVVAAIAIKDEVLTADSSLFTTKEEAEERMDFFKHTFGLSPSCDNVTFYRKFPLLDAEKNMTGYSINVQDRDGDEFTIELQQHDI